MKTILITAYAVNPYKGSEDGTGWNITRELAKEFKVILITRKNNIPHLERYFANDNSAELKNIEFHGFDLSERAMRIKKKMGTKAHVVYFYLWQRNIVGFIRSLNFDFDVALSLNFHSDSHPHFLWKLGKPSLWGPIGHHPKVPVQFILRQYGWKAYLTDRFFAFTKWSMRTLNPAFHRAVTKSELIFVINSAIPKAVGGDVKKIRVLPAVASTQPTRSAKKISERFTVLCSGRFHFIKGFDISLAAFAQFYHQLDAAQKKNVEMVLVGNGPEEKRLKKQAVKLGLQDAVKWVNWIPHDEMLALYERSNVFLFPSHEGAGMVVPEAMSYGVPVLTFDNCGPGEIMGLPALKVPYLSYQRSAQLFAHKLAELFQAPSKQRSLGRILQERHAELFTWQHKGNIIKQEILNLIQTQP